MSGRSGSSSGVFGRVRVSVVTGPPSAGGSTPSYRRSPEDSAAAAYNPPVTLRPAEEYPMSDTHLLRVLRPQLEDLRARGLYKSERQIQTPQGADVRVNDREVINFCANNYLGLAN